MAISWAPQPGRPGGIAVPSSAARQDFHLGQGTEIIGSVG